ncbi:MAG TPA: hypothetical protein VL588_10715 [Bdellovibrionota bacterium]|nr:hypothetical protein [Bdellovibrionota bacterium]
MKSRAVLSGLLLTAVGALGPSSAFADSLSGLDPLDPHTHETLIVKSVLLSSGRPDAALTPSACPTDTLLDPRLEFHRTEFGAELKDYCASPSADLCALEAKRCKAEFPMSEPPCVASHAPYQPVRVHSIELLRRARATAREFFDRVVGRSRGGDTTFVRGCCGTGSTPQAQACRRSLAATELYVLPADPDETLHYTAFNQSTVEATGIRNRVLISDSALSAHLSDQGIEELVLHELSHSCQFSRLHLDAPDGETTGALHDRFDHFKFNSPRGTTRTRTHADLAGVLSPGEAQCLDHELEGALAGASAATEGNFPTELFAEAYSASLRAAAPDADLGRFIAFCHGEDSDAADHLHPSNAMILRCLGQRMRDQLCRSH